MDKTDAMLIYLVCAIVLTICFGMGFGTLFSKGIGWIVSGLIAIIIFPGSLYFNRIINKYL